MTLAYRQSPYAKLSQLRKSSRSWTSEYTGGASVSAVALLVDQELKGLSALVGSIVLFAKAVKRAIGIALNAHRNRVSWRTNELTVSSFTRVT